MTLSTSRLEDTPPKLKSRLILFALIVGVCVGLDQVTKTWAIEVLHGSPNRSYLGGWILLIYAENTGAWGSMGAGLSDTMRFWILTVMPFVFLGGLTWYTFVSNELKLYMIGCYSFVIGGGLGNLIDRAQHGFVVDFLWMGIPNVIGTNIFNIADVAIMTGVITLILMHILVERHVIAAKEKEKETKPQT